MNETFVSYSHIDKVAVSRILDALKSRGIDPWYDQEDIPASSLWRSEVSIGISACHNFVYCLSNNSVASPECDYELKIALEQDKRIIPVIIDTVDHKLINDAVKEINWVFLHDFDAAIEKIVSILDAPYGLTIGSSRIDSKISILIKQSDPKDHFLYRKIYLIARNPLGDLSKFGLIPINDRYVSRQKHCWLILLDGRWYIVDGGSTNGTKVNNKRLKPNHKRPLRHGDIITLSSDTTIKYSEILNEIETEDVDDRDTLVNRGNEGDRKTDEL